MIKRLGGAVLALAGLAVCSTASAEDLHFKLNNASGLAITNFYASPANVGNWEQDILADDVLAAYSAANVTIGDGSDQCVYDMLFVMEDGQQLTEGSVDLCELGEYTLYDE